MFPSLGEDDLGEEDSQHEGKEVDNDDASVMVEDHDGNGDLESLVAVGCLDLVDSYDLEDLQVRDAQHVLEVLEAHDVREAPEAQLVLEVLVAHDVWQALEAQRVLEVQKVLVDLVALVALVAYDMEGRH